MIENNKPYSDELQTRIKEYNQDFQNTLLKGLELKHLACQFKHQLGNISTWYTSDPNTEDGLELTFDYLRIQANIDNKLKYIVWHKKQNRWTDLHQKEFIFEPDKVIEKVLNQRFTNNLLLIYYNIDLNKDSKIDLQILCLFEFKSKAYKAPSPEKLDQFVKYPTDFFTSPVMSEILNDFNVVEKQYAVIKKQKEQERDFIKRQINDYGHMIYRTIGDNIADFEAIQKMESKEGYLKVTQEKIGNVKKRNNFIRIATQLLNNTENITLEEFKDKKTLQDMIRTISDIYVSKHNRKLEVDCGELGNTPINEFKNNFFLLLWNLIGNADQYNESDKVICRVLSKENEIWLSVMNQGNPVNIEKACKIIDAIAQSNRKTNRLPITTENDIKKGKGYKSIFDCLEKLSWTISYETDNNYLTIYLKTTLKWKTQKN